MKFNRTTSGPTKTSNLDYAQQSETDLDSERLSKNVDNLLQLCTCGLDMTFEMDSKLSESMMTSLMETRDAIVNRDDLIQNLSQSPSSDNKSPNSSFASHFATKIFEKTNDGVIVLEDQKCLACNDNATRLLKRFREQILSDWISCFSHAKNIDGQSASQDLHEYAIRSSLESGFQKIFFIEEQDQPTRWFELAVNPFSPTNPNPCLLILRDITAQKKLVNEIQRHRDFLSQVINAVPDQIYVRDADEKIVVANNAFVAANQLKKRDPLGAYVDEVVAGNVSVPNPSPQSFASSKMDILESSPKFSHTVHKNFGKAETHRVVQAAFRDDHTGHTYVVSAGRNVTDDLMSEDRLKLLASVFEGAAEGVAILDDSGKIKEANPALLKMVSVELDEVTGQPFSALFELTNNSTEDVLQDVVSGTSWTGKASYRHSATETEHFWISLNFSQDSLAGNGRIIALVSDISELERTQRRLKKQAYTDSLTGLPNRRFFREALIDHIERYSRFKLQFKLCFLDLDDFKVVNDCNGHEAGDMLLIAVTKRLQSVLGDSALLARFGGDEFAFLIPHEQLAFESIDELFDNLLDAFQQPFEIANTQADVGISIGVTEYPCDAIDADTLLRNADIAMYAAKADGKNQVREFDPVMQTTVNLKYQVQSQLRRALSDGQISLMYQPKILAANQRPHGCEALVRWRTKDDQFISPNDFVPIAEQSGIILPLGEAVFQTAAEQAFEWSKSGPVPTIAVNVSPRQLRHPNFVEVMSKILSETRAQAEWFELEITENAMVEDVEYTKSVIEKLRDLGFSIAIDDFGTGYSSLSYLKDLGIQTLKIDNSFVKNVATDQQTSAIVNSIVSLGAGLGLKVIAEGVENQQQAHVLRQFGCPVFQGFYFARPMVAEDYYQWLQATIQGNNGDSTIC